MHETQQNRFEENEVQFVSQIAAEYFGSQSGIQISVLGGGDCNINYLVATFEKKIVIKLSKPDREDKALQGYTKERWCIAEAAKRQVRTPEVVEISQKNGRAYMIQSFLEGAPVANLDGVSILDDMEKQDVWQTLGRYAHEIHSISVTGYGDTMTDEGVFTGSWLKHLQYNIDSLNDNDELIKRRVLTKELSERTRAAFLVLKEKDLPIGLSHADIALRNAIVSPSREVFLLDWDTAKAEVVPHYDFNEILRDSKPSSEAFNAFLKGYGMTRGEFQLIEQDLLVLNLLRSIDTLRWAIDRAPEVVAQHEESVRQALERLGWL